GVRGALLPGAIHQEVEDGHAHGDAVGDLIHDDRVRAVGDVAGNFDAAVHRARVQDDDVRLGAGDGALRQAEVARVLVDGGEEILALAFELDPQDDDDVGVAYALL